MDWKIPLTDLDVDARDSRRVLKVLRSKWWSMGPVVQEFEAAFAAYLGVTHAFAVTNGTAALHLAALALGLKHGDEVIVPSLTFVATASAMVYTGATPVFADIAGLHDLTLSPEDTASKISSKTRAIAVMHYGGFPADLGRLMALAKDRGLAVIEDAAHAPGAMWKRRKVGTIGDVGCFSFYSNKNLPTGEGGMIVTNRDDLAEKIGALRSHALTAQTWERHQTGAASYDVTELGYNYRMDELRAALGLSQLAKLSRLNRQRHRVAGLYVDRLRDLPGLQLPFLDQQEGSAHHLFPVLLGATMNREAFKAYLMAQGIQTSQHYPPVHLLSYYRKRFGGRVGQLPLTEAVGRREVTLPLYPGMSEQDVDYVVEHVRQALARSKKHTARSVSPPSRPATAPRTR